MKISTKGTYGLKAMVDLAYNCANGKSVTLKSICERQNISERYLEQIIATLRKANIVNSIKGSQGGYILAESASQITVGRILRAVEGTLHVINSSDNEPKDKIEICIQNIVWDKLNESIDLVVDSITLEDLVFKYDKTLSDGFMLYI
jgi:Rrf2 family protein